MSVSNHKHFQWLSRIAPVRAVRAVFLHCGIIVREFSHAGFRFVGRRVFCAGCPFPRPYPCELEETVILDDGSRLLVRPMRPGDASAFRECFKRLREEDIIRRFFAPMKNPPEEMTARFTHIDYDHEMAFVAMAESEDAPPELRGLGSLNADQEGRQAEFSLLVRSDVQHHGLGRRLMARLIRYARERGFLEIHGDVIRENKPMLKLCEKMGFVFSNQAEDPDIVRVSFMLKDGRV